MRTARRMAGIAAMTLAALAVALVAAPAADAAPAQNTRVQTSSHCEGFIFTNVNLTTETATSSWTFNPSIFFPPVCQQAVVAFCVNPTTGASTTILGNFTIQPGAQSTATCPAAFPSLTAALVQVQHAP